MNKCFFCKKQVDDEDFCYGCNEYVCDDCDEIMVMGNHTVDTHKYVTPEPYPKEDGGVHKP